MLNFQGNQVEIICDIMHQHFGINEGYRYGTGNLIYTDILHYIQLISTINWMGDHEERVLYGSELHYNIIINYYYDGWMNGGLQKKIMCIIILYYSNNYTCMVH